MATKRTPVDQRVRESVKRERTARGMTQEGLSERADLSLDAINRIEHGSRTPTLETIDKIARALGLTVGDLVDGNRRPPPPDLPAPLNQLITLLERQPDHVQDASLRLARVLVKTVEHEPKR